MNIYLAGKINGDDYRHRLMPRLRNWDYHLGLENASVSISEKGIIPPWPIWENALLDQYNYTGPYFVSCDHGCWHGDNTHATIGNGCAGEPDNLPGREAQVLEHCKTAIRSSDIVFAWIEDATCFGTIAEIGYAHALGKKIYIAGPRMIADLWFVYAMAQHTTTIEERMEANDSIAFTPDGYKNIDVSFITEYLLWCIEGVNHRIYINSAKWRAIADAAKIRAGNRCQVCNRPRGQVILDAHHRTYERLGWELPDDITVLCRDCHGLYEANKRAARTAQTTQPTRRNRRKR